MIQYITKRSGDQAAFDRARIETALEKATRSVQPHANLEYIIPLTDKLVADLETTFENKTPSVEDIQDRVEKALMAHGFFEIAKAYILYREKQKEQREKEKKALLRKMDKHQVNVVKRDGSIVPFDTDALAEAIKRAIVGYEHIIDATEIAELTKQNLFEGVSTDDIDKAVVMVMKARIEKDPAYSYATAQVFMNKIYKEVFGAYNSSPLPRGDANTNKSLSCQGEGAPLRGAGEVNREPEGSLPDFDTAYRSAFKTNLALAAQNELVNPKLLEFDLDKMAAALLPENDRLFTYLGIQTLYDRYFINIYNSPLPRGDAQQKQPDTVATAGQPTETNSDKSYGQRGPIRRRIEAPQTLWMRVAMGLAIAEKNKEEKAIEFYNMYSKMLYTSSTPTLFNSGTMHSQLSSCYLSTVEDDLGHIFKVIGDDAQLSKFAGGLGNDWTNVRATGARIKGTNGESQGVIPFLKIANDTAVAVNQGGKRKGAMCAYLECWHLDVEDFLELRKNTGDERRRTHDMNTANWIPDLFMQRVKSDGDWTLFSPNETPELHHLYGAAFKKKYEEYEALTKQANSKDASGHRGATSDSLVSASPAGGGTHPERATAAGGSSEPRDLSGSRTTNPITVSKTLKARDLWRKMLTMLFETGHPWVTFKDPCNVRSPQDHVGVVHNSNLCTEITLNTSAEETAVCNLGSVNLGRHVVNGKFDIELLKTTVATAMRMLDNVIDINFYPTKEAETSNKRHRPVGLGVMGLHDAMYQLDLAFETQEGVQFSNDMMEAVSYASILASTELAKERGTYQSYKGSKWDRNILPIDTLALLEAERGETITTDRLTKLNWEEVRNAIKAHGMRNSNCMAIAPTATISNIVGCVPCIEPIYKNLYVKSNLSGEFTIINPYLIEDLKKANLWSDDLSEELKYYDGSVQQIEIIPDKLKAKYKEVFEIDPFWLVKHAAVRAKWIDQSQSVNVFIRGTSGKLLSDVYFAAWESGMKTTYYLRSLGASQVEKSTVNSAKYGFTHRREYEKQGASSVIASTPIVIARSDEGATKQSPKQEFVIPTEASTSERSGGIPRSESTPLSQKAKDASLMCSILKGPDCEACQ